MTIKQCTICGASFVAKSNNQKYCSDCKGEAKRSYDRKFRRGVRKARVAQDKATFTLGPNLPKSIDWDDEARKVKNEVKRTFRSQRTSASANQSISARKVAIEDFTYDVRDDDFKGSIDDFFAGKDD
jgi:predicted  nucleic acid-binding Zn-ribbon protein